MNNAGAYVTGEAIKWALNQLRLIQKDQAALFFCLAISNVESVKPTRKITDPFVNELLRYIGAPVKGGGTAVFNPVDGKWRSENYISSTVFGRLLNGSHWWTGSDGFLTRTPALGWPATIEFKNKGFQALFKRIGSPNLAYTNRLPLQAVAILYFKNDLLNIDPKTSDGLAEVTEKYKTEVIRGNNDLLGLFKEVEAGAPPSVLQENRLTETELMACFPPSPHSSEPKQNALLYQDDINELKKMSVADESIAETFRRIFYERKTHE